MVTSLDCLGSARLLAALLLAATVASPSAARAQTSPAPPPVAPVAPSATAAAEPPEPPTLTQHTPLLAAPAETTLVLSARFHPPGKLAGAFVIYRSEHTEGLRQAAFRRGTQGDEWIAEIPGSDVVGEHLAYAIEGRGKDGSFLPLFATRDALHRVQIQRTQLDAAEAATLARLDGRRSVVSGSFEFVSFGSRTAQSPAPLAGTGASSPGVATRTPDRYIRSEVGYTYRMLRNVAEIGLRIGIVRGRSPGRDEEVGLNYGSPHIRFRAAPSVHFEVSSLTSVTEVGFALGGGGSVHLGDPYGTKLVVGLESVQVFGTKGFSRLDLATSRGLVFSPIVEITDMPHATKAGVRLLFEVAAPLGQGFSLAGRVGYQARDEATGGPTLGLATSYAF
jgi:hypothetical protein